MLRCIITSAGLEFSPKSPDWEGFWATISRMEKNPQEIIAELELARDRAQSALTAAVQERDMNRSLALQFETELLDERQRLASLLGSEFAPLIQTIRALSTTVQNRLETVDASVAQMAAMISSNADELILQLRQVVGGLQVSQAEEQGLIPAARALLDDWRLRETNKRFELLLSPGEEDFGLGASEVEAAALRTIKESLERIGPHDGVRLVVVSLNVESGRLSVQISADRSVAAICGQQTQFAALVEQLIRGLGGHCQVDTGESGGCEVVIRLPWGSLPV